MIDIAEEVKELYRTDYIPYRDKTVKKELRLHFPELNLTITNENIYTESMKLEESLCSESELVFGGCEAAKFEIAAAGVTEELIGKQMIVTQRIADTYDVPFGAYIVDSVVKKDDLIFKDITAYDHMLKADIDVSEWYNSLTFPIKLKEFRLNLCQQLRFSTTEQILPNDDTYIKKTVEPSYLKGRDVLRAIGEINAAFGHFTRDNKFKFIGIAAIGLYPSETLYPEEDLFPSECTEYMASASYKSIQYEDYMVEAIDSVQIRQEEGDTVGIATSNDMIESFIFSRTLSGIQSLTDSILAAGNQTRKNEVTRTTEIEQLKGKTLKITKIVDALEVEMSDLETETNSKFEQTSEHFTTEVNNLKEQTNSKFEQTSEHFIMEISRAEGALTSKIEQTATGTISVSDRNKKKDITYELDKYAELFKLLQPCSYRMIDGKSGRTHLGFISQDVEESMQMIGMDNLDFAGFCKDTEYPLDANGNEDRTKEPEMYYSLRYQEFISLNTYMIQKQREEMDELRNEITGLKQLLKEKGGLVNVGLAGVDDRVIELDIRKMDINDSLKRVSAWV